MDQSPIASINFGLDDLGILGLRLIAEHPRTSLDFFFGPKPAVETHHETHQYFPQCILADSHSSLRFMLIGAGNHRRKPPQYRHSALRRSSVLVTVTGTVQKIDMPRRELRSQAAKWRHCHFHC